MVHLDFSLELFAIEFVFGGELDPDFIGIPSGPFPSLVLVNDLAVVTIDIGLPGEDIEDDTASRVIPEVEHRDTLTS